MTRKTNKARPARALSLLLTLCLLLSLLPAVQAAPSSDDDMTLLGAAPYAQGGEIASVTEQAYSGSTSLKATGRANLWEGVAWTIPAASLGALATDTHWVFSMQARSASGDLYLSYNFEFHYNDGTGNKYMNVGTSLTDSAWSAINADWILPEGYLTAGLDRVVIYPCSGEGQLGDYYVDAVSLTAADDMSICGAEPYAQGGSIFHSGEMSYTGGDCLKATGRTNFWEGIAWSIPAANLGTLVQADFWQFSLQARAAAAPMHLNYNLEFWYSDGSDNKYLNVGVDLGTDAWTELSALFPMDGYLTQGLDRVVIYPASGEGQLGDYYVDAPMLNTADGEALCGILPCGQGCNLTRTENPVYAGQTSLLSGGRTAFYHGAAWSIPVANLGTLMENNVWTFSLEARTVTGTMNLNYNFEFWYNDSTPTAYRNAFAAINAEGWTELTATFTDMDALLTDGLDHIVIYPASGEAELGDYYVDAPSLTGESITYDDMTLCGQEPYGQANAVVSRVLNPAHSGADSLYVTNREFNYSGAAWSIPAANLGTLVQADFWQFSLQARAAAAPMHLNYNLEFWYSDGSDNKYLNVGADLGTDAWTELSALFPMDGYLTQGLDRVVIYPVTGEAELGDYYLDSIRLTGKTIHIDDMTICAQQPYVQGEASMERVNQPVSSGFDSIKLSNRYVSYAGLAWTIPADALGSLKENRLWELSMALRTAGSSMTISYNLEFWYNDGTPNDYRSAFAVVNAEDWTTLTLHTVLSEEMLSDRLDHIVIYPSSGENEFGDYYIDDVSLLGKPVPTYTITWNVNGITTEQTYSEGDMPHFEGNTDKAEDETYTYNFAGWSPELSAVSGNVTYTAQYTSEPKAEPHEFEDVAQGAWYYDSVHYVYENGLMLGTSDKQFSPEAATTRAMLVTILWRMDGSAEGAVNSFKDVAEGKWYTQAIAWAAENGIVNGVGNGCFNPNDTITREQIAVILFRYATKKGIATDARTDLHDYADAADVSNYALEALQWAVSEQLFGGMKQGEKLYMNPQGNATRAQVATILMRYVERFLK